MKVERVSTEQVLKKLEILGTKNERVKLLQNDTEELKKKQRETMLKKREVDDSATNQNAEGNDQNNLEAPKKQLKSDEIVQNPNDNNKKLTDFKDPLQQPENIDEEGEDYDEDEIG